METINDTRIQVFKESILDYRHVEFIKKIYRFNVYKIAYSFQDKRDLCFLIESENTTEKLIIHYKTKGNEILHSVKLFRNPSFDKELAEYLFLHFEDTVIGLSYMILSEEPFPDDLP